MNRRRRALRRLPICSAGRVVAGMRRYLDMLEAALAGSAPPAACRELVRIRSRGIPPPRQPGR